MQKPWMQRRELLFTTAPSTGSGSGSQLTMDYSQQLPVERSRDNRTQEEKTALLEWVRALFFSFFFRVSLSIPDLPFATPTCPFLRQTGYLPSIRIQLSRKIKAMSLKGHHR
jgi:hypothetical protein